MLDYFKCMAKCFRKSFEFEIQIQRPKFSKKKKENCSMSYFWPVPPPPFPSSRSVEPTPSVQFVTMALFGRALAPLKLAPTMALLKEQLLCRSRCLLQTVWQKSSLLNASERLRVVGEAARGACALGWAQSQCESRFLRLRLLGAKLASTLFKESF
jgi:hypothetical protein